MNKRWIMNNKLTIVIVIALVLIIGSGYSGWWYGSKRTACTNCDCTPTPATTEKWSKFDGSKLLGDAGVPHFPISFEYPKCWNVQVRDPGTVGEVDYPFIRLDDKVILEYPISGTFPLVIECLQYFMGKKLYGADPLIQEHAEDAKVEDIIIDGVPGKKIEGINEISKEKQIVVIFEKEINGELMVYSITAIENAIGENLDHLLSTFKFTK